MVRRVNTRPPRQRRCAALRVPLLLAPLCLALGACVTSPRGPIDASEYTLDTPGFPNRPAGSSAGHPPNPEPAVRQGRLAVVIDGVAEELEILTAAPPGAGPLPLALISHGVPPERADARAVNLRRFLPIASSFARRGYLAVVFARRGFASSTGDLVGQPTVACGYWPSGAYVRAARDSARDYAAVLEAMASRPDVDGSRVVAVGQSVGGLTVLALAESEPEALVGVINFAGGHGGNGRREVCNSRALRRAFATFGRGARVPALWLYSTADRFFWPSLVRRNFDAYAAGGAPARLAMVGPLWFTRDGHHLVNHGGRELWQPRISAFLRDIDAPGWQLSPGLDSVARPPFPEGLSRAGRRAWLTYGGSARHKAFAVGDDGWGWAVNRRTPEEAARSALGFCREHTSGCRVIALDGRDRDAVTPGEHIADERY